jgi:hypothetical protein
MKRYRNSPQMGKSYGKETVKRMVRNAPRMIRGWRPDLRGGYRDEGRG